jgi:hypothetical protein
MTCSSLCVALALWAGGGPVDLASLMPGGTTVFLEFSDVSASSSALQAAPVLDRLGLAQPDRVRGLLKQLAAARIGRGAVGLDPSAVGVRRWVVVVEAADPGAAVARLETWAGEPLATLTVGDLLVIADSAARLDEVREIAGTRRGSLALTEDFQAFRAAADAPAPIRFWCDAKQLWPRPFRAQIKNPSNLGLVVLGGHMTHVLKTAGVLSGTMSLDGGIEASLTADIRETDSRAFTEVNPTAPVLAMPEGFAGRLSVSRSLARFWARRGAILADDTRAFVDSLAATITAALPGWGVEALLGQVGEAFDVYFAAPPAGSTEGYPALALVAVAAGRTERCQLLAEFQRILAGLSAQGDVAPVFREEASCHRGVSVHVSRPGTRADAPASLLVPTFAVVQDRVIVGNHPATVTALVDQLLDSKVVPRVDGDELEIDGARAAHVVRGVAAAWAAEMAKSPKAESRAALFLTALEAFLAGVQKGRLGFDLAGKAASLKLSISAPALFSADLAASRPR